MRTIVHPYENLAGGEWIRGNLHTHTTASDGRRPISEVVADYAGRGYGFLMISDHDILTGAAEYGSLDPGRMVLIPGNEITANGPHLLHVNADRLVAPDADRAAVIAEINRGAGFAIVNHPNWLADFNHCPLDRMVAWSGYVGMEIYNGTIGRLDGSPYATNKWDMLLAAGRRVWGFANDDSHRPAIDIGLGWNMVYAEKRTPNAIVDAMAKGRFYASTGVTINHIAVRGNRITIKTDNARRIVALMQTGRRFEQVDNSQIEIEVPDHAAYVRFECWGDGESFAWTQPFFVVK
jgi:hypothetical protein